MHGAGDRSLLILRYASISAAEGLTNNKKKLEQIREEKRELEKGLGMTPLKILEEAARILFPKAQRTPPH